MSEKRRVLIIGLDGATFDLLRPWMEEGRLPNLAAITRNGASGELQSTIPHNSPPAWTSFMTGKNPGKHGVYGFTVVKPRESYSIKISSGAIRRAETVWQILSAEGKRSIVFNVPMTYPPDPINGLVVTGIDTPGLDSEFAYPPELRREILNMFPEYILDVRSWAVTTAGERRAKLLQDIMLMVEQKGKLALHWMERQPWDLFTIVFTATDRVQHFFWRYLDGSHPLYDPQEASLYQDAIFRVYQKIDETIDSMLALCDARTTVIVMSDHGFGPQYKLFRINEWLRANGFLQLRHASKATLIDAPLRSAQKHLYRGLGATISLIRRLLSDSAKDSLKRLFPRLREKVASQVLFSLVDWSKTRAYHTAEFPGSIRINLKGREMHGIVEPGDEYERLRQTIQSQLEKFRDPHTGQHIVERVFRREELYSGPYMDLAPDLIMHLADQSYTIDWYLPASDGQASAVIDKLTGRYAVNCGYHRMNGILIMSGRGVQKGALIEDARLVDITPTVLYLLGLSLPMDFDGRVLTEALTESFLQRSPIQYRTAPQVEITQPQAGETYSEDEAQEVAERLRMLGYLD